jgi:hypothetical protein
MQDLKAGDGAKKTWDLEVESDHDGPVTVAWPSVAALPRTLRLRVTDAATGRTYDPRSTSSLTLNLAKKRRSSFARDRGSAFVQAACPVQRDCDRGRRARHKRRDED